MIDNTKEYILCAAVWYNDGKVYEHQPKNINTGFVVCGQRHANCFMILKIIFKKVENIDKQCLIKDKQGFLTSLNRYVTRKEAFKIAKEAGQLNKRFIGIEDSTNLINDIALFSEDIY